MLGNRLVAWTLVLALLGGVGVLSARPTQAVDDDDDDDGAALRGVTELVVKLQPTASIRRVNERYGTRTVDVQLRSRRIYLLRPRVGGRGLSAIADRMEDDAGIVYAEPNFKADSPEGNPRHRAVAAGRPVALGRDAQAWRDQWAVGTLRIRAAHGLSKGNGTVVAVLDTGVRRKHPQLRGRLAKGGYDYVSDDRKPWENANGRDDDGDGLIDESYGHGTHVAGIVARTAPLARILPMRVLDSDGGGDVYTTAEAIYDSVARGADVINMSFGTRAESDLLEEAIEEGEDDVVFVASTGNSGSRREHFPAATDDVVAVTATTIRDERAPWANFGRTWVDVAAPGSKIVSPFPLSAYARWSGTSMAAPWVSGQAALLRTEFPGVEAEDLAEHIARTAQTIGDPGAGAGRVQILESLQARPPSGDDDDDDDDDDDG